MAKPAPNTKQADAKKPQQKKAPDQKDAAKKAGGKKGDQAPPPSKSHTPLILGGGAAAAVLAAALAAVIVMRRAPEASVPQPVQPQESVAYIDDPDGVLSGAMTDLGDFVLNLGSPDVFFTTSIQLEFYDFEPPEDFKEKKPILRDKAISILGKKTPEQLLSPAAKEKLRLELILALNAHFSADNPIIELYFSKFTVQ